MTQTGDRPNAGAKRRLDWKAVLGLVISAALLYYAFRDVDFAEVLGRMREADPVLLTLSAVLVTLVFPLRAFRWKPLLEPTYPDTRFRPRFAATCIGFMANNLLPARVGEFARAYALTRLEPIRVSASFGSLVVERLFDGILVVILLLVSMAWPSFPEVTGRDFSSGATTLAIVFALVFIVTLAMVLRPEASVRVFERLAGVLPQSLRRPIVDALAAFLDGLAAVRDWKLVVIIFIWSAVVWLTNAFSFWVAFLAFDIDVPFIGAVFLQSLIALAVALPSAPGFFGVWEAGARVGLVDVWGVESSRALAFALGFHIVGFIPITVMGLWYVWRLGLTWGEVGHSEEAVEAAVEGADAGNGPERSKPV